MTLSAVVSVVIGYVAVQCGLRLLDPTSIRKTYLPGIVATFEMNRDSIPRSRPPASVKRLGCCYAAFKGSMTRITRKHRG